MHLITSIYGSVSVGVDGISFLHCKASDAESFN